MALAPLGIHALRDIRQERFQGIQGLLAGNGPIARRLHRESFRVGFFQSHDSAGSGVGSGDTAVSKACLPISSASARTVAGVSGFGFRVRFLIAVLTIILNVRYVNDNLDLSTLNV
jgi:hypothetical protein